jgi:hypothetical protein
MKDELEGTVRKIFEVDSMVCTLKYTAKLYKIDLKLVNELHHLTEERRKTMIIF